MRSARSTSLQTCSLRSWAWTARPTPTTTRRNDRANGKAVVDAPSLEKKRTKKKLPIPDHVELRGQAPHGEIRGDEERLAKLIGHFVVVRLIARGEYDVGATLQG